MSKNTTIHYIKCLNRINYLYNKISKTNKTSKSVVNNAEQIKGKFRHET